jgi:hypothetical protein
MGATDFFGPSDVETVEGETLTLTSELIGGTETVNASLTWRED